MKIILLQDIKNIGKKFDVKDVSDGYARNLLLPRGLAKLANEKSIKELETQKANKEKREKELKKYFESLAKNLTEREFVFSVNTGKKGEMFGSITKNDIKEKIYSEFDVLRKYEKNIEIFLEKPIKTIENRQIEMIIGKEKCKLKIKIEPL